MVSYRIKMNEKVIIFFLRERLELWRTEKG